MYLTTLAHSELSLQSNIYSPRIGSTCIEMGKG
jgi:hypothetical protein